VGVCVCVCVYVCVCGVYVVHCIGRHCLQYLSRL